MESEPIVLVLGSAPDAIRAASWPKPDFFKIVCINNAWRIRDDWDYSIFPDDFPKGNRPARQSRAQTLVNSSMYVPANNQFGGVVYAGATMAFTSGYWALSALKPRVLAYLGCDMIYEGQDTHFYGKGEPDPLRNDVTLASLEAKSARLMTIAAKQNCACVNLSELSVSRLLFPRANHAELSADLPVPRYDPHLVGRAFDLENSAGYLIQDGKYWNHTASFDPTKLAQIDRQWLSAAGAR